MQHQLAIQEIQLAAKNAAADKLIGIVSAESEKVKRERFIASEEEKRVRIIEEDVSIKTKLCEQDLRQAEPALVAAQAALNTLNKNNLTELKSFGSPPKAVVNVCAAVMVLLATNGKIPRDRSWKTAKLMMVRVDQFLNDLLNYNKDNIHPNIIETLQEYLKVREPLVSLYNSSYRFFYSLAGSRVQSRQSGAEVSGRCRPVCVGHQFASLSSGLSHSWSQAAGATRFAAGAARGTRTSAVSQVQD